MQTWLRRARGAIGMGLTRAVGGALASVLIGAPLPALAMPGFPGGMLFSAVLGAAVEHPTGTSRRLPR